MSSTHSHTYGHLSSLDVVRVIGALSVFWFHFTGDAQRAGLHMGPLMNGAAANSGPFGVSLFLVISGFGLALAFKHEGPNSRQLKRRLWRLYSEYWWVAIPLLVLGVASGNLEATELWKVPFWLTGAGVLFRTTFYPMVDAWWYVGLAIQVVLLFPLILRVAARVDFRVGLVLAGAISGGFAFILNYLGASYLAIGFIGYRLLELGAGAALATSLLRDRSVASTVVIAACAAAAMYVSSGASVGLHPVRVVVAVLLVAVSLKLEQAPSDRMRAGLGGIGAATYCFYLAHSPWAAPLIAILRPDSEVGWILTALACLFVAVLVSGAFRVSFLLAQKRGWLAAER